MSKFIINRPVFDAAQARASFTFDLDALSFTETLDLPKGFAKERADEPAFIRLLDITAAVLGTSYYKLRAPFDIAAPALPLSAHERAFIQDVYENGLGEFYARNDLKRFGKLNITSKDAQTAPQKPVLQNRILLPIGGGKDSLVSVQLLEKAGVDFTPFAVNPKGPILTSVEAIGKDPLFVTRTLDAEMIRLGQLPDYYNGHVPSTAINSMIGALVALLFGYNQIALSNERSASEGNMQFDGRETNHQHSKSVQFEQLLADTLAAATDGALTYYSLLRPYSEAKIANIFARETRFDHVFSSCNRNFRLSGNDGALWCGTCPKCLFTFIMMAPNMPKERLIGIFGQNLLANEDNRNGFAELTGLSGQKPWECVGEILEAAACLWQLVDQDAWKNDPLVKSLRPELEKQYGAEKLEQAFKDLHIDATIDLIPQSMAKHVAPHAV